MTISGVVGVDDACTCDDKRERGGAGRPKICSDVFKLNLAEEEPGRREIGCKHLRVLDALVDDPLLLRGMATDTF